jgi:hypothetical protein
MSVSGLRIIFPLVLGSVVMGHLAQARERSLRGVFLEPQGRMVGKVAIQLLQPGGARMVPVSRPFHTGERFRLQVSSSQSAWVYLLHSSPSGKIQRLWPTPEEERAGANRLNASRAGLVPGQGSFVFDRETGEEHFTLYLRSTPGWPPFPGATKDGPPVEGEAQLPADGGAEPTGVEPAAGKTTITNFFARGVDGEVMRGVTFEPSKKSSDLFLYFSWLKAGSQEAAVQFRLVHRR